VTSLAPGDSHCDNGGAVIGDGSGNFAFACNGANLNPFSAVSDGTVAALNGHPDMPVPGLSVTVLPNTAGTYLVNAVVTATIDPGAAPGSTSIFSCDVASTGGTASGPVTSSVSAAAPDTTIPLTAAITIPANPASIQFGIECQTQGAPPSNDFVILGGSQGQSTMNVIKES
jgi:hypothetical protein